MNEMTNEKSMSMSGGTGERKITEKIINKLEELIVEFNELWDVAKVSVERLGGPMPPSPEDPGGTTTSGYPEIYGDSYFNSVVEKIERLRELERNMRIIVERLNELS